MFGWIREIHRRRLRRKPLSRAQRKVLESIALYRRLPPSDRAELEGHIQVFLAEKRFEGCGGLRLAEAMKITVAAQACVLLLHRKTGYFPGLESILIYPAAYLAKAQEPGPAGTVSEFDEPRLGESWGHGTVVLSWEDIEADAAGSEGGCNVVLHEFAHQLDGEDEDLDGTPPLGSAADYQSWARVMEEEFDRLEEAADRGEKTLIDPYGTKDPAEFFAVVTECFFEKPAALLKEHSQLYAELKKFYRQDPAAW